MKRKLFNLTCALSLVLCLVTVALWVRSHSSRDGAWVGRWNLYALNSGDGRVAATKSSFFDSGPVDADPAGRIVEVPNSVPRPYSRSLVTGLGPRPSPRTVVMVKRYWEHLGFSAYDVVSIGSETKAFIVPHWALLVLAGALPGVWMLGHRGQCCRRRAERGLCIRCGYDLRATPDRCPECGTSVPRSVDESA